VRPYQNKLDFFLTKLKLRVSMATHPKIQNMVTFSADSVMHTTQGDIKVPTKAHDGLRPLSNEFDSMIKGFIHSGGHIASADQVPKGRRRMYISRIEEMLKSLDERGKAYVLPQGGSDTVLGIIHIPRLKHLLEWLVKVDNPRKRKFKSMTDDSIDIIHVIATYSSGLQNTLNIPVIIDGLSLAVGQGLKYVPGQHVDPQTLLKSMLAFLPALPNPSTLIKISTCLYITSINCDTCGETCCEQCDERGQKILDLWKYIARPDRDAMLSALWEKSDVNQDGATMPEFPSWDGKFFFNSDVNSDVETARDSATLLEFCTD
jgi:hypothetical protein